MSVVLGQKSLLGTAHQPSNIIRAESASSVKTYINDLLHKGLPSIGCPNQELSTLVELVKDQGYRGEICRFYISENLLRKEELALYHFTELSNNRLDVFLSDVILTPNFFSKLEQKELTKWLSCIEAHFTSLNKLKSFSNLDLRQLMHATNLLSLICQSENEHVTTIINSNYNISSSLDKVLNKLVNNENNFDYEINTVQCISKLLDCMNFSADCIKIDTLISLANKYALKFKETNKLYIGGEVEDECANDDFDDEINEFEEVDDSAWEETFDENSDFEESMLAENLTGDDWDNFPNEETEDIDLWSNFELRIYDLIKIHSERKNATDFWLSKMNESSIYSETYRVCLDGLTCASPETILDLISDIIETAKSDQMACFNIIHLLLSKERLGEFCEVNFENEIFDIMKNLTFKERTSIINRCYDVIDQFTGTDELTDANLAEDKLRGLALRFNS